MYFQIILRHVSGCGRIFILMARNISLKVYYVFISYMMFS